MENSAGYLKAIRKMMFENNVRKVRELMGDYMQYIAFRKPKVKGWIPHDNPEIQNEVVAALKKSGFEVVDYEINVTDYRRYLKNADYSKFPDYWCGGKGSNFPEKSVEHYLAAKVLDISKEDVYIDVANDHSPAPDIYHKLHGCVSYKQDLIFPIGITGNIIGGDASNMPVADGFATKIALHCSFEHFEQDSDIRFIKEAGRVLRVGGRLCIVPLYLFNKYAIQTDLSVWPKGGLNFEREAVIYFAKGWGNRHARVYDVPHFITRIRDNLCGMRMTVYSIKNPKEVHPSGYVRFMALFEKSSQSF